MGFGSVCALSFGFVGRGGFGDGGCFGKVEFWVVRYYELWGWVFYVIFGKDRGIFFMMV